MAKDYRLTLDELQELFTVPFFVWTNYDSESKDVELTSLNYLSTMTLQQAGIELPAYNQFLADLQEEIPAMNSRAFYSRVRANSCIIPMHREKMQTF